MRHDTSSRHALYVYATYEVIQPNRNGATERTRLKLLICRYDLVARLGIYDIGDLISGKSGYFASDVGSPSATDAMKR